MSMHIYALLELMRGKISRKIFSEKYQLYALLYYFYHFHHFDHLIQFTTLAATSNTCRLLPFFYSPPLSQFTITNFLKPLPPSHPLTTFARAGTASCIAGLCVGGKNGGFGKIVKVVNTE